ncbi:DUF4783 domain-containing protein [Pedobacter flavus]|uniref:DUF4783 domain-containing protein n=1 Tax=Pedobacter flavus TaxID=3113906 RepID=A0ABU7GYH4_9SPHI|nr:DUF4783 domain-containing protein [Pedobacter sp. VNH31]MEE1883838.1 DUF4783 domain-containing protein [Pedobacter sp. VNH31]
MKRVLIYLIFTLSLANTALAQSDPMDALYGHFKNANSKEIAKSFSSSLEIILLDQEDVYSKAQAEQILRDFFIKNPPLSYVKVHSVGNTNVKYRYGVIILTTKNGKFRVSILMDKVSNGYLISELKIESEK